MSKLLFIEDIGLPITRRDGLVLISAGVSRFGVHYQRAKDEEDCSSYKREIERYAIYVLCAVAKSLRAISCSQIALDMGEKFWAMGEYDTALDIVSVATAYLACGGALREQMFGIIQRSAGYVFQSVENMYGKTTIEKLLEGAVAHLEREGRYELIEEIEERR